MAKHNGHKNRNHWSVALWLLNEESSYRFIMHLLRIGTKDKAADRLARELAGQQTPDGAPYTRSAIRAALVGL